MKIDLEQLTWALSNTIDLVGVDEIQHGKRVAYMALQCAEEMGLSRVDATFLYRVGLLHDCGVSSTKVHKSLVNELEWEESERHCEVGAQRMSQLLYFSPMANIIKYHHTRWEDLKNTSLTEFQKRQANLIFLLDRVDALASKFVMKSRLSGREEICQKISGLKNNFFQPDLIDSFLAASSNEAFWITMEARYLEGYLQKQRIVEEEVVIDRQGLKAVANIFAQIVDAKSPYTAQHSFGVASLSKYLAMQYGLDLKACGKIEIAGLLHDLGKLQVPDIILEQEDALDRESLATMRHHSFITLQILKKIKGMEDISLWAADHHEKLDGSGYPFRKKAKDIPIESRIVAVADIFQALAQDRPYRLSQSIDTILGLLEKAVHRGQLDARIVGIIQRNPEKCYLIAKEPTSIH